MAGEKQTVEIELNNDHVTFEGRLQHSHWEQGHANHHRLPTRK